MQETDFPLLATDLLPGGKRRYLMRNGEEADPFMIRRQPDEIHAVPDDYNRNCGLLYSLNLLWYAASLVGAYYVADLFF